MLLRAGWVPKGGPLQRALQSFIALCERSWGGGGFFVGKGVVFGTLRSQFV